MHGGIRFLLVGAAAATLVGTAIANSDLAKLEADSNNWAAQSGDFALSRHSKLNQINKTNVHKMQVAWTFSTGVLRGHEGGPSGHRRHALYSLGLPEQSLGSEPGRPDDQMEVRAEAGSVGDTGDVLRHGQPWSGLCGRQDLPAAGRHHAGRSRLQDRQGGVVGEKTVTRKSAPPTRTPRSS